MDDVQLLTIEKTLETMKPFTGTKIELVDTINQWIEDSGLSQYEHEEHKLEVGGEEFTGYGVNNGLGFVLLYARKHSISCWMLPDVVWAVMDAHDHDHTFIATLLSSRPLTPDEVAFMGTQSMSKENATIHMD